MKPANPLQDKVKSGMGKAVPLILGGILTISAAAMSLDAYAETALKPVSGNAITATQQAQPDDDFMDAANYAKVECVV